MPFSAKFNVTTLNGTNGFVFIDDLEDQLFGWNTANLEDINNDGQSDLIVTTHNSSQAYVVFGASSFPDKLFTSNLNGSNGFRIIGEYQRAALRSPAAGIGDINGDGIDDFIIGSFMVPQAYVIFGAKSFPPRVSIANLDGSNGFKIIEHANCGFTVCGFNDADGIGDINGDGKSDFILSYIEHRKNSSAAFVVYGSSKFPSILDISSLDGANGFAIVGSFGSSFGVEVAGIGDFNGDAKPDFVAGTDDMDNAYVIFGANRFPSVVNTSSLNGTNGFTLINIFTPYAVVVGIDDINGDSLPDLGIGSQSLYEALLIFGAQHFNATFDVSHLNGANGVKLVGNLYSSFGYAISGVDATIYNGKSGVIIGDPYTKSAYVFFGADHFPPELHTSNLNGTNGFEIVGPLNAGLGYSVAGIDNFNGDGKPAIVVGTVPENTVYVIFDSSI